MPPSDAKPSFIIIGAGVFGASTAYHLAKATPSAAITLIDRSPFPCPLAASHDYNKIVRADYGDKFYMSLALKSHHEWRTNPLYKQFFHTSGMVNIEGTGLGRRTIQNFKDVGAESKAEIIGPEQLRKRYPLFWNTDYKEVEDCYVNPEAGRAEAASALRAVVAEAVDYGVEYVEGSVSKLVFDDEGDRIGAELKDGRTLAAGKVIQATGANTAKLLADSAPERQELQPGDRIIGAAVVCEMVELTDQQVEVYKDIPLFLHQVGGIHETYPPTPEKIMKFTRDISSSYFQSHKASNQRISSPPTDQPNEGQMDVPESLKEEIQTVVKGIWGRQFTDNDMKVSSRRICWDSFTPNQDFIISSHPAFPSLYFAAGSSFHSWKFLPIIGEYVTDLLRGKLDHELVERRGWDRSQEDGAQKMLMPKRDLRDLINGREEGKGVGDAGIGADAKV